MDERSGEEFREFMHGRWPSMVRLAYGLTGDLGHAEDVVQAAFARAYASWPRVRRSGNPDAYVRQIVVNENRNRFRKHRVPEHLTDQLPEHPVADATGQAGRAAGADRGAPAARTPAAGRGGPPLLGGTHRDRGRGRAGLLRRDGEEPGLPGPGRPPHQHRTRGWRALVSVSDEHDLQDRLDQAFQAVTPRPAPLDQAVRQGRLIRLRRRLAATAGLAVVAAGVAVPVLLHQQAAQPALIGPRHPTVTVSPAGPHAPAGLIASGTAGAGTGGSPPPGRARPAPRTPVSASRRSRPAAAVQSPAPGPGARIPSRSRAPPTASPTSSSGR